MGRQFPGCSHDWLLREVLKKEVKIRIIPRPQSLVSSKHLSRLWQTCRIIRIATLCYIPTVQCAAGPALLQTIDQGINTPGWLGLQAKVISYILKLNQSLLKIIEPKDGQRACVHTTARVPRFS